MKCTKCGRKGLKRRDLRIHSAYHDRLRRPICSRRFRLYTNHDFVNGVCERCGRSCKHQAMDVIGADLYRCNHCGLELHRRFVDRDPPFVEEIV